MLLVRFLAHLLDGWRGSYGRSRQELIPLSLVCLEPLFPPRLRAELAECCKPARGSCSPHWLLPLRLQRCLSRLGMQVSVPGQVRAEMRAAEIRWHQSSRFVPPCIARNATSPRSARQQAESLVLSLSLSLAMFSVLPASESLDADIPRTPETNKSTNLDTRDRVILRHDAFRLQGLRRKVPGLNARRAPAGMAALHTPDRQCVHFDGRLGSRPPPHNGRVGHWRRSRSPRHSQCPQEARNH